MSIARVFRELIYKNGKPLTVTSSEEPTIGGHQLTDYGSETREKLDGVLIQIPFREPPAVVWNAVHNLGPAFLAKQMAGYGAVTSYHLLPKDVVEEEPPSYLLRAKVRLAHGHFQIFHEVAQKACAQMLRGKFGQEEPSFVKQRLLGREEAASLAGIEAFPIEIGRRLITSKMFREFTEDMQKNPFAANCRVTILEPGQPEEGSFSDTKETIDTYRAGQGVAVRLNMVFPEVGRRTLLLSEICMPALLEALVGAKGEIVQEDAGYIPGPYCPPYDLCGFMCDVRPLPGHTLRDVASAVNFTRARIVKGDFGQPRFCQ